MTIIIYVIYDHGLDPVCKGKMLSKDIIGITDTIPVWKIE